MGGNHWSIGLLNILNQKSLVPCRVVVAYSAETLVSDQLYITCTKILARKCRSELLCKHRETATYYWICMYINICIYVDKKCPLFVSMYSTCSQSESSVWACCCSYTAVVQALWNRSYIHHPTSLLHSHTVYVFVVKHAVSSESVVGNQ